MPLTALTLVLAAAVLHSTWNLLAKAGKDSFVFLWLSLMLGALAFSPLVALAAWRGELAGAHWGFIAATSCVHALYFFSLGQAYQHGDFSRVYPLARGLGVALVPVFAFATLGETLAPGGLVGVGLVVLGILVTSWLGAGAGAGSPGMPSRGTIWGLVTGGCIGAYSTIDTAGARANDPVVYVTLLSLGSGLIIAPLALRRRQALRHEWRVHKWRILLAASMNLSAYLLVLSAMRLAKAGYVVAGRETSIVIGAAVGALVFKEGSLRARLPGALVILGGVACIAFAG